MILVTSATGNVGKAIVQELIDVGADFRIGARNTEKARALGGGEVVTLDFTQPATFDAALRGVKRLFTLLPPGTPRLHPQVMSFLDRARTLGVRHVVYSSGMGVERQPADPMRQIERHIETSGLTYTLLRPNWFMQNFNDWMQPMVARGEIVLPVGDAKTSYIDVRDIAAVTVPILLHGGHENTAYTLTGPEPLSHAEIAAKLSAVVGHPVVHASPPVDEDLKAQRAQGVAQAEIDTLTWLYADMRSGFTAQVTPHVAALTGRPPITFDRYLIDYADAL